LCFTFALNFLAATDLAHVGRVSGCVSISLIVPRLQLGSDKASDGRRATIGQVVNVWRELRQVPLADLGNDLGRGAGGHQLVNRIG
jgi:hypothetical protein